MHPLIDKIIEKYSFSSSIIEELNTIILAWESLGMSEKEIIQELKDYKIYL
jgi:hypothetical protein